MCGIAGVCLRPDARVDADAAVQRMCDRMRLRGPDAAGQWTTPDHLCVLGHRRLSIIDPDPRSNQPMTSRNGRFAIVLNGEIYNYAELRRDLQHGGCVFRTGGDTEVMLELLARDGIGAVERLRGMFAFALWDNETRTLYLGRDPYGIKPLYFGTSEYGVFFASQVKALGASGVISRSIDPAGLAGFFLWGSVPEPWTIHEAIKAVPAGSTVTICDGRMQSVRRYAAVARAWERPADGECEERLGDRVREALVDSVRAHLVADVPVGVFLSGGIDSGTIAGVMAELGGPEGVTIGFAEFSGTARDEVPAAKRIAEHFGISHTVRMIERREFEDDLPTILDAMDQPSVDGVNTWFAAKAVAERGYKVVLSGVGGDELFCGYDTFHTVPRLAVAGRIIGSSALLRLPATRLFGVAGRAFNKPKLAGIPALARSAEGAYFLQRALFLPEELAPLIGEELAAEGLRQLRSGWRELEESRIEIRDVGWPGYVAAMESTHYLRNQLLRDADWASMAHSLELRTPLVDYKLARSLAPYARRFAKGAGKLHLSAAPRRGFPAEIMGRRKTGFALPIGEWLGQSRWGRSWQQVPLLRKPGVHWARRWTYAVAEELGYDLVRLSRHSGGLALPREQENQLFD